MAAAAELPGNEIPHGHAVTLEYMMACRDGAACRQLQAGRMNAGGKSEADEALRLVEGDEVLDAVAETAGAQRRIFLKPLRAVGIFPGAFGLKCGGIIPVVQGHEGTNAFFKHLINEPVVEIDAFFVDRAGTIRQQPRPGDRKTVVVHAKLRHQRHVFLITVIMVAGDIAGMAFKHFSGSVAELVPHRKTLSIFKGCAFNLIGRGRGAPDKILTETHDIACFLFGFWERFPLLYRSRVQTATGKTLYPAA